MACRRLLLLTACSWLFLADAKGKKPKAGGGPVAAEKGWNEKTNEEGKVVQELKIEAPSMTEEDQYGYKMPDRYKCDSCRAVMFHLDVALKKAAPKSRRMKQWEYTDTFDDACKTSFEGYGIKLHNGENTLSGPGLTHADAISPGMGAIQMGGETWGKRLTEACKQIIYERMGEDELYDKFKADGGLSEDLCYNEVGDCKRTPEGPVTPPKPKEEEKKPKAKKAEKPKKEKKEEKKEKKEKKESAKAATSADADGRVDAPSFLRNLAVKHGLDSSEYLTTRTEKEWEKLILAVAGRIYNRVEL